MSNESLCKCGHYAEVHTRYIPGTDDKGCRAEKVFDNTVKKLFDDEKQIAIQTQKFCDCKKFVPRSVE